MPAIEAYLKHMSEKNASDLYFTTGAFPSMRVEGTIYPVSKKRLVPGQVRDLAYEIMSEDQQLAFETELELNIGLTVGSIGRFRVNVYMQRGEVSMVIRFIKADIPSLEDLSLPSVLSKVVAAKKGLVLIVGSTGSGKSTTLASMIDFRNQTQSGHILTIEDPIEYMFEHKRSIIGQREVGMDTLSYDNALREAMREAPDVIVIGEVRDRTTMEAAVAYADTGHLCLSTLHAVNAYQALERVINLFPREAENQILMDLSLNLKAIISQRLVPGFDGNRVPAVEVLLVTPYIADLIRDGEIHKIKEVMGKGGQEGMQTFDQSLYDLYSSKSIALNTALDFADSRTDLEWRINFGGGIGAVKSGGSSPGDARRDSVPTAPDNDFGELIE